jgi:hypothetical protein
MVPTAHHDSVMESCTDQDTGGPEICYKVKTLARRPSNTPNLQSFTSLHTLTELDALPNCRICRMLRDKNNCELAVQHCQLAYSHGLKLSNFNRTPKLDNLEVRKPMHNRIVLSNSLYSGSPLRTTNANWET